MSKHTCLTNSTSTWPVLLHSCICPPTCKLQLAMRSSKKVDGFTLLRDGNGFKFKTQGTTDFVFFIVFSV